MPGLDAPWEWPLLGEVSRVSPHGPGSPIWHWSHPWSPCLCPKSGSRRRLSTQAGQGAFGCDPVITFAVT